MNTEFEVKILDIDVGQFQKKLDLLSAKKVGEFLQRRYVYDLKPKEDGAWLRLLTNEKKTTLTVKKIEHGGIDGTKELEVSVGDFEKMHELLVHLGHKERAYQENRRISYRLGKTEIEIDHWPHIPPYVEVEDQSAGKVKAAVKKLGYTMDDVTTKGVLKVYEHYGIDIFKYKELKF